MPCPECGRSIHYEFVKQTSEPPGELQPNGVIP